MSEFDSLSDSDWLDISSGRDSDVDSIMSGDSDRDGLASRPYSRRSSISIGSSREGEIDAWEGFIEESGDEVVRSNEAVIVPQAPHTADLAELATAQFDDDSDDDNDPVEDEKVKEALDQSLISTLSASRSSSGTAHNSLHSLRDLRLSFPDPLTSSLNDLHRAYEDSSPDILSNNININSDKDEAGSQADSEVLTAPMAEEAPAPVSAFKEMCQLEQACDVGDITAEFEVYLYGFTSANAQYTFAEELLKKALDGFECTTHFCTSHGKSNRTYFRVQRHLGGDIILTDRVYFEDRTTLSDSSQISLLKDRPKRPSLAIIYLPSQIGYLPEHTLYLPVFSLNRENFLQDELDARKIWASLEIPPDRVARLTKDPEQPILDSGEIVSPIRARGLLRRMISEGKKRPTRTISDNIRPVHAVTLFALMSLVVGCAMNPGFRKSSHTPTPTVPSIAPNTFWGIFGQVNQTPTFATTAKVNAPVLTSAQREVSLSVFNPGTTSSSTTKVKTFALSAMPPTQEATNAGPSTSVEQIASTSALKLDSKSDIIIRPTTQLAQTIDQRPTAVNAASSKFNNPTGSKTTSLDLVVESLSQALDYRVKSIRDELDELVCSLDDLGKAIRRQSKKTVKQSKGKAKEIREDLSKKVMYRHERARGKAKQLRQKGEEILSNAGGRFKDRTTVAKKRAQDIRKSIADSDAWRDLTSTGSEVWKAYQSAQMEWASKLQENSRGPGKGGTGSRSVRRGQSSRAAPPTGKCWEGRYEAGGLFNFA